MIWWLHLINTRNRIYAFDCAIQCNIIHNLLSAVRHLNDEQILNCSKFTTTFILTRCHIVASFGAISVRFCRKKIATFWRFAWVLVGEFLVIFGFIVSRTQEYVIWRKINMVFMHIRAVIQHSVIRFERFCYRIFVLEWCSLQWIMSIKSWVDW